MDSNFLEDNVDDISFSTDDRALCLDNRHRSQKSKGLFGKPTQKDNCFNWTCWKFCAMATICVLLIAMITVLWRTCESTSSVNANTTTVVQTVSDKNVQVKNSNDSANCGDFPWSDSRLPLWVQPDHYILRIHPNITVGNFTGTVDIELTILESTDIIILNSKHLNIVEIKLSSQTGKVDTKQFKVCSEREQLAVPLSQKLPLNGKYTLSIKFSGQLTDKMDGLYRSTYTTVDGQRKYVAVTQFESTDARAMIPCWDEPMFKAEFTVKVVREPSMFSLSNMECVKNETLSNGLVEDTFEKSVKMSPYLLAIVVCDFERISNRTVNGVLVSVYAPALQISQAQWALTVAIKGLEYYEKFFKVKYPLKKLDLISLNDFAAGAMENWGLITFRDTYLLYDPQASTTKSEESVATVVLHELAHQWFGNLVTMKWWNDLWLNEGFADFLETYATAKLEADWNLMATFVADNVASAMYLDGLIHTHPISVPVKDPAEIESVFDAISYQKGASVLRMVMGLVGEDKMKESLSDYLTKFKYSNAEGKDLWDAINKHVPNLDGLSMSDFTTNFTQQSGYPVVSVECKNGKFYANQTRFFFLNEEMEKAKGNQTWHIHLTVTTDSGNKVAHWMKKEKEVSFDLTPNPKWFKVNDETNGFYRVNYEEKNWKALIKQLIENHSVFSPSDRAGLINDAFAFLRLGNLDVEVAFEIFKYLEYEKSRGSWAITASHIFAIETNLRESESYMSFKRYMKNILSPIYKKVGWQQLTDHEAKLTQQQILILSCKFNVDDCRVRAIQQFQDFLQNKTKTILSDHRAILCGAAVQNDSGSTWDTVFKLYNSTKVPSEKIDYLRCLGFTKDSWRLSRLLEMTLNPSDIRPNLMATVISQVASNINGKYLSWRFIQRRYDEINKLISSNILSSVIKSLGSFNTKFDYDQINSFFKDKKLKSSKPALDQTLEGIRINIQFMEVNELKIKNFLDKHGYKNGVS